MGGPSPFPLAPGIGGPRGEARGESRGGPQQQQQAYQSAMFGGGGGGRLVDSIRTASERCRARSQLVRRQRTLVPAETRDAAAASPPSDAAASVGRNDGRIRRRHGHAVPPSQRRRTQFRRLWLPS